MRDKTYLAIDLGASSGRVVAGRYDGKTLVMEVVHRFNTLPFDLDGTLRIDLNAIFTDIVTGIKNAVDEFGPIVSAGVDSWGGQHVIIDADGELVEIPYHYRDSHTKGFGKEVHRRMSAAELYRVTGSHESQLPGLLAHIMDRSLDFHRADRILLIPDFFNYRLCGRKVSEYTNAVITQFVDIRTGTWSEAVLDKMDLPRRLFGEIVPPATYLGDLDARLIPKETGPIRVVAVASHDTASALGAAPLEGERPAFISLGTWAILGYEVTEPLITDGTFNAGFQNSSIMGSRFALSRSFVGLWILEECRRAWQLEGRDYSFQDLVTLAGKAEPFAAILNLDSRIFFDPGEMVSRVRRVCESTGQRPLKDDGEVVRTILEGLALSFRRNLSLLASVSGRKADCMHVVGGGSRNVLLNQLTANACGMPVIAGPAEATAAGNMMAQLMADGEVASLEEGRRLIARSFPTDTYAPRDQSRWDDAYERLLKLIESNQ